MKFEVKDLSGIMIDDSPIQLEEQDLYQNKQRIGTLSDEGLDYLIENRNDLLLLKFVEPLTSTDGQLIDVKLFVSLKHQKEKRFRWIKVAYYGFVIIASLISFFVSLFGDTSIWLILFFFIVLLSSTYLLIDYLNEFGYLERLKK